MIHAGAKSIVFIPANDNIMQRGQNMSLITCTNTAFAYDGVTALKNLNFAVEQGDYLCIAGENGSGKSTLIKGLLRLKKPSEGTIALGDGLHFDEIGYLPQQTAVQRDFPASVREVVLSGCLNRLGLKPFYTKKERELAQISMKRLGIGELKSACYRELSGGQQRRVLLARALCAAKKLILLDEPAAGLDPLITQELYDIIGEINAQMNMSVIMVSHDIAEAVKYANKVLHLQHEQVFFGSSAQYAQSEIGMKFMRGEKID